MSPFCLFAFILAISTVKASVTFDIQPPTLQVGGDNPTEKLQFFCKPGPEFTYVQDIRVIGARPEKVLLVGLFRGGQGHDLIVEPKYFRRVTHGPNRVTDQQNLNLTFDLRNLMCEDGWYPYYCSVSGTVNNENVTLESSRVELTYSCDNADNDVPSDNATVTFSIQPPVFQSGGDNPTRKLSFYCEPGPEFTAVTKTTIGRRHQNSSQLPIIFQYFTAMDYVIADDVLRPRVKSVVINKVKMSVSFELENAEPQDAENTYYCKVRGRTNNMFGEYRDVQVFSNITDLTPNTTQSIPAATMTSTLTHDVTSVGLTPSSECLFCTGTKPTPTPVIETSSEYFTTDVLINLQSTDNAMSTSIIAPSTASTTLSSSFDFFADRNVTSQAPLTRMLNIVTFLGTVSTLLSSGLI